MKTDIESLLRQKLEAVGALAGGRLLVAYSGGPDSTALLAASVALRSVSADFTLEAVYIDHCLRSQDERREERTIIQAATRRWNVPLHLLSAGEGKIVSQAGASGSGVEAAARQYRYSCFENLISHEKFDYCLLAHTLDDQVETILQRLFEGAALDSSLGIPERRGPFFRPFLSVKKSDLLDYLRERNFSFSTDSTNGENLYLRNRIRNEIIPVVASVFPAYRTAIESFLAKQRMADSALRALLPEIPFRKESPSSVSWDAESFFAAPEEARRRFLYRIHTEIDSSQRRLPYPFVERIIRMDDKPEALIEAFGSRISRRGDRIFWDGVVVLRGKNRYIRRIQDGSLVNLPNIGKVRLSFSGLTPPVIIRYRMEGDVISTTGGKKRLKKLFQEWALPQSLRNMVPVLEDSRGIAAVLGSPFGFPDRYAVGGKKYCSIKMEYVGESREQTAR
ncbi:tRNA lysidine(34) synthetase TilS [Sediminispirochaeta bajacaliforniensis]|uniref:tRNA lysidine(34) synthetase TilS n=1 Tax=Sediminispirochaeta bajacaliforniensis TaxID=148 RepID=UPI00035F80A4|nr:tRNA lysidine(34) synthetase TilS [Sediminispirochaeta bajacaliforniensis]